MRDFFGSYRGFSVRNSVYFLDFFFFYKLFFVVN